MTEHYENPVSAGGETAEMPYSPTSTVQSDSVSAAVLDRNRDRLLGIDGVQGVGIGRGVAGEDVLIAYVRDSETIQRLPAQIEGYPVHAEVTGPITAY
jgi:hypothetical protein